MQLTTEIEDFFLNETQLMFNKGILMWALARRLGKEKKSEVNRIHPRG